MNRAIKNQINKTNVMTSTFFIPLAVPFFLGSMLAFDGGLGMGFLGLLFFGMIIGAIFYIPSILGALLVEAIMINANSTKNSVIWALTVEGILAFLIIGYGMEFFSHDQQMLFALFISIGLPQVLRWFYLQARNRMYKGGNPTIEDTGLLDDLEIEENVEY